MATPQKLIDALKLIDQNADIRNNITVEQLLAFAEHANGLTQEPAKPQQSVSLPPAGVLDEIVKTLRKNPGGLSSEHLQRLLNLPKPVVKRAIDEGLESGVLKKRGERRGTKYYVK